MPTKFSSDDMLKQTAKSIVSWKKERQDLVVSFCKLLNIHPIADKINLIISNKKDLQIVHKKELPKHEQVLEFCQLLIDYITAGHFSIFEKIFKAQQEADTKKVFLESKYLSKILHSTNLALDFNNKYSKIKKFKKEKKIKNNKSGEYETYEFPKLKKDLSNLMLQLEDRFKLEDLLINHYYDFSLEPTSPKPRRRRRRP